MNGISKVFTWPCKKYRAIQRRFSEKTPYEKWRLVAGTCDFLLRCIGVRVVSDCKRNWLTPLPGFCTLQYAILCYYTAWYYWDINKVTSMQPQMIMAFAIPAMVLYFQAIGPARYRYRKIVTFSGQNIYLDRQPSTEYERKVDGHAGKLLTHSIITTIFIFVSFTICDAGPMYAVVVHGEYITPTGVILPFLDPDTGRSFAINVFIQMLTSVAGFAGMISMEILSCIINNTYTAMADMVCFNMRKFSDGLRLGSFTYQNKLELRNVFVQLQDLEVYLNELNDIYYWRFFSQPILTTGCVALAILSQLINGFPGGYGYALCFYFQLFVLCFMGNRVKSVCHQIECELYEVKWYLMPPKYQTQVTAALQRWQTGCVMTIGPFEELNFGTATKLTQKIYSTLMLFLTFMSE